MATRLVIDGYGQLEINNCAFRRDGRIEAQCKPDATDFSDAVVENGMILAVDNVARTVKFPTDSSLPVALVYSAEHMYDERKPGLKNFYLNGTKISPTEEHPEGSIHVYFFKSISNSLIRTNPNGSINPDLVNYIEYK